MIVLRSQFSSWRRMTSTAMSSSFLFVVVLLLSCLPSAVSALPIVDSLLAFWKARTTIERAVLGIMAFFVFAGFTGLDGGKPKPKIQRAHLEDAIDPEGVNSVVYFDVSISDEPVGRITMELFHNHAPKTAENFRALCTGERGKSKISGKPLHYKGCTFHRIIPGFVCQGGDFTHHDGRGGESIYGKTFDDEWTNGFLPHSAPGLLSCANAGKDTNGSQFFITLAPAPWLDLQHVVFGRVLTGFDDVVKDKISKVKFEGMGDVTEKVVITNCGQLKAPKLTENEAGANEDSELTKKDK